MAGKYGGRSDPTSNSVYGSHYNYNYKNYAPSYDSRAGISQPLRPYPSSSNSKTLKTHTGTTRNTSPNKYISGERTQNFRSHLDTEPSPSSSYNSEFRSYRGLAVNDVRHTTSVTSRAPRFDQNLSSLYASRMKDRSPERYPGDFSNFRDLDSTQHRTLGTGSGGLTVSPKASNYTSSRLQNISVDDKGPSVSGRGRAESSKDESDQSMLDGNIGAGNVSRSYVRERSRNRSGSPKVQRKVLEPPPSYEESLTEGTVGLENMGNTCYFNSAIQCISSTPALRDTIVGSKYNVQDSCDTKGKIISALKLLLKDIWLTQKPFSSVRPRDCLKAVAESNSQFQGYRQQDAQEMLLFLLNALSEETNRVSGAKSSERRDSRVLARPKSVASLNKETADRAWDRFLSNENSFVTDVIAGQLESILECKVCTHKSVTYESFFQLSLPIPSPEESSKGRRDRSTTTLGRDVTLDDCFKLFCEEEILEGDNAVLCEKCRKPRRCSKTFKIQKLPDVLIIQIKRFSLDFMTKIDTPVVAPLKNLCLLEYMTEFQRRSNNIEDQNLSVYVYRLYAVIDHMGSPRNGHYIAKCLVPHSPSVNSTSISKRGNTSRSPKLHTSRSYVDNNKRRSPKSRSPSDGRCNRSHNHSSSARPKSWWLFDDSSVSHVDERDVVSPYNYILFYEKVTD